MAEHDRLHTLAQSLVAALRRDAAALEGDGAADLGELAGQLERLLAHVAANPSDAGRRALLEALDEVERFHRRIEAGLDAARSALSAASHRRLARRAYGEIERLAPGRGA